MEFIFTEDDLALREAVSRFLMTKAAPEVLRDIWQGDSGRSPQLRSAIAEQGVMALSIPEMYDGLGMGDLIWSLMSQELGYFAIPDSLIDTAYVGGYLVQQLPDDISQKENWLKAIAHGELRIAIAHSLESFVADAHLADVIFWFNEEGLFALQQEDVSLTLNTSIDSSRRIYHMQVINASPQRLVGAQQAEQIQSSIQLRGALANAGQHIGLAQRMLDLSIDYVNQRKQFGKLIGSFQAIKHKLADVVSAIEIVKPALYRAAFALENNQENSAVYVSQAVLQAREASKLAAKHGIQAHGAMGYTWEVDHQMFMKRCYALQNSWGRSSYYQKLVFEAVLAQPDLSDPAHVFSAQPDLHK